MQSDFLVVGAGIIGISIARELKARYADATVVVLDKEPTCGGHASGRNSGVLHAGFYYTADSLKARFTRDGNRELTEYCLAEGLPINRCGKVVVARDAAEDARLDELLRRAQHNGVRLEAIDRHALREIEPRARSWDRALYSPDTSSVDPLRLLQSLEQRARAEGVQLRYGVSYLGRDRDAVLTSEGRWPAGYLVNAAGLYADRVARDHGFGERYRILPFKGLYLYSDEPPGALRTHVYPVPDLRNPFLGVHFTVSVDGRNKIGPTAIPAFWREHYQGLDNFCWRECTEIVGRELALFTNARFDFFSLAVDELRKYSRGHLVRLAGGLVQDVDAARFRRWGRPGMRAQLVDVRERRLEMDFVLEGDAHSMHVLNAVSPAFTCALPFARHVCDAIAQSQTLTGACPDPFCGGRRDEDSAHGEYGIRRTGPGGATAPQSAGGDAGRLRYGIFRALPERRSNVAGAPA